MMPPPAPSETNQLATGPVSAAQEARDLAEALRRSREDAAPAPPPAEPSADTTQLLRALWKEDDDRGSPDSDLTTEIRNRFAYNMKGIGW